MESELLDRASAETFARWFRALADPTRIQLLALIAQLGRPVSVGELTAALPVGQSTVSHHLAALASVRFVQVERHGTAALYSVNPRCVECFPSAADLIIGRAPPDPSLLVTPPDRATPERWLCETDGAGTDLAPGPGPEDDNPDADGPKDDGPDADGPDDRSSA